MTNCRLLSRNRKELGFIILREQGVLGILLKLSNLLFRQSIGSQQ